MESQFIQRAVFVLAEQMCTGWCWNALCLKDFFGNTLIHRQGTSKRIRSGVTDAEDIKGSLQFAIFSQTSMQSHKCNICHGAEL